MSSFFALLFLFFIQTSLQALSVGSNTAYSRQSDTTFPLADTDNTMLGFAAFEGGFSLADGSTTCTFDSLLPVSKLVNLAGGRLYLSRDLSLTNSNPTVISNVGTVLGNGIYSFETAPTNTLLMFPVTSFVDTYVTGLTAAANVNSISWAYDSAYLALATNNVAGSELIVYSYNGSSLTLAAGVDIGVTANCVQWYPSGYYLAVVRATSTTGIRVYLFNPGAGTLTQTGSLTLGANGLSCAWHNNRPFLAVGSASTTVEIRLFSFNTGTGAITSIQSINLTPNRTTPTNGLSWAPAGYNLLAIGTTRPSLTVPLMVYDFNGTTLTLSSSADPGVAVSAVDWSPTSSIIAVGLSGSSERLRLYQYNKTVPSLTEVRTARIGKNRSVTSIAWDTTGTFLRIGNQSGGGAEILETYYWDKYAATLTKVEGTTSGIGAEALAWAPNNNVIADADNLAVRVRNVFYNRPLVFKDARISLQSPTVINQPTRFIGQCTFYGNGNSIRLGDGVSLSLLPKATLSMHETILSGVGDSKLLCFDDSATFSFVDSKILLERDLTFSSGGMHFEGDVIFSGTSKLNYTSGQTSTIAHNATLYFDRDFTFSYAPRRARTNLLYMNDATSMLFLNGCSLTMTRTGLALTQGSIVFDNRVTMSSQARNSGEASIISSNVNSFVQSGAWLDMYGLFKFQ